METPILSTIPGTRIRLRRLTPADVDGIYTIFSDPKVMRYWSTPPLQDKDAAAKLIDEIGQDIDRGTILKWGIALNTNDAVIGTTTLFNLDLGNGRAEIGYALARDFWGQGYMSEALQVLLEYSFNLLPLRRLEADVDPRNDASIRTLERLGFRREGFLRERWHVGGEIQDALFYGLLKREWQKS